MWVVTNKDESKWLYEKKPERNNKEWYSEGMAALLSGAVFPFNDLPSFINNNNGKMLQFKLNLKLKRDDSSNYNQ